MSTLDVKARELVATASSGPAAITDVDTVKLIVTLLADILKLYKACNKNPVEVAASMQAPGFFARRRLRRLISSRPLPSNMKSESVFTAVLKMGKTLTPSDVTSMFIDGRTAL